MYNNILVFNNDQFGQIRTVLINNDPWFIGRDAAVALGYSNASKTVIVHLDEEDKCFEVLETADSQNGNVVKTKTALINEWCLQFSV